MIKRIAWRLQALAERDLTARARRRAGELARDADLRLWPSANQGNTLLASPSRRLLADRKANDSRLPAPGTTITRRYKGATLEVKVLANGFEYAGAVYRSLIAVAKAVSGSHCSGYLFFRIGKPGGGQ